MSEVQDNWLQEVHGEARAIVVDFECISGVQRLDTDKYAAALLSDLHDLGRAVLADPTGEQAKRLVAGFFRYAGVELSDAPDDSPPPQDPILLHDRRWGPLFALGQALQRVR